MAIPAKLMPATTNTNKRNKAKTKQNKPPTTADLKSRRTHLADDGKKIVVGNGVDKVGRVKGLHEAVRRRHPGKVGVRDGGQQGRLIGAPKFPRRPRIIVFQRPFLFGIPRRKVGGGGYLVPVFFPSQGLSRSWGRQMQ